MARQYIGMFNPHSEHQHTLANNSHAYLCDFLHGVSVSSCFCGSTQQPEVHNPNCIALLQSSTGALPINSISTSLHGSCSSASSQLVCCDGPLALLKWPSTNSDATAVAADGPAKSNMCNAAAASHKPDLGAQVQHTSIVEGCSQPCWDAAMQFQLSSKDVLLRLQVRCTSGPLAVEGNTCESTDNTDAELRSLHCVQLGALCQP
jgi:hypothetical protein